MASMGPFPSERIGRDIDDLPIWADMNAHRYEWNEFYCSTSWNIAPFHFEKILVSPGSPIVQKEVVKRRRSSKSTVSKRGSLSDSIKSEEGGKSKKSRRSSIKKKKKKSLSEDKVSKPKSKKKKKKKKIRSIGTSNSSLDSFCSFDSVDIETSAEFSSASLISSRSLLESTQSVGYAELPDEGPGPLVSPRPSRSSVSFVSPSASLRSRSERSLTSFGPLSPSMGSLGESRNSIMGCDISEDVMKYIDECYQEAESVPAPPLETAESKKAVDVEDPPKKSKKKKKKRKSKSEKLLKNAAEAAKEEDDLANKKSSSPKRKSKSKEVQDVVEKEPSSTELVSGPEEEEEEEVVLEKKTSSMRSKAPVTMETLPEEITLSGKLSQPAAPKRSHARSLSPKRTHRFSKLMVVADGSIRRVVEKKNKSSFWESSAKRRGSVKQSIHAALGGMERSLDFEDSEGLEKAADFSVATEITDPWHNSWSVSSDSFRDDSDRAFKNPLLSPNPAHGEHIKRVKPL